MRRTGTDAAAAWEGSVPASAAAAGVGTALEEAYRRYAAVVFAEIYGQTRSPTAAEDLTAEVFCRLAESLPAMKEPGRHLRAWLHIVARNLVIDARRRRKRQRWLPLQEGLAAGDSACPLHCAERRMEHEQLMAALEELTGAQRQVILLRFVEGYSNAETAAYLGKDENSVKALQHRALSALRRRLGGEDTT